MTASQRPSNDGLGDVSVDHDVVGLRPEGGRVVLASDGDDQRDRLVAHGLDHVTKQVEIAVPDRSHRQVDDGHPAETIEPRRRLVRRRLGGGGTQRLHRGEALRSRGSAATAGRCPDTSGGTVRRAGPVRGPWPANAARPPRPSRATERTGSATRSSRRRRESPAPQPPMGRPTRRLRGRGASGAHASTTRSSSSARGTSSRLAKISVRKNRRCSSPTSRSNPGKRGAHSALNSSPRPARKASNPASRARSTKGSPVANATSCPAALAAAASGSERFVVTGERPAREQHAEPAPIVQFRRPRITVVGTGIDP